MTKAIRESSHEGMAATVRFPELQDAWIEPGRPIAIQGFTISAGLFYVGDALPFAISPTARVERPSASSLPCWTWEPHYRSLYPSERGLYLSWLASGRTQPAELPPSSRIGASVPPKPAGLTLDPEKVKALTDESASIQGILSRRLGNLEEPNHRKSQPAQKVNQDATADAASSPTGQPALAGAYQAALRDLLQRTQWSRAELEALAKRHCLLPFAFYQAVNEWTMAAWGDYLLNGQEVVHVNQQLLNQIPYE